MDDKTNIYSIRNYNRRFSEIVKFFSSYMGPTSYSFPTLYSTAYFTWKIASNPFGQGNCYLRYQNGLPAAHCSVTPKPFNPHFGIGVACAELGDTHTHPNFQRRGHFGVLGSHVISDYNQAGAPGDKLIYGLPNANALPGWTRRCNCALLDGIDLVEMVRNGFPSTFQVLKNILIKRQLEKCSYGKLYESENLEKTSSEIDGLWEVAEQKELYILKKDASWWRWRYVVSTEKYKTYFLRANASQKMIGYIVVKIRHSKRTPFRHFQIADVFSALREDSADILSEFLRVKTTAFDKISIWVHKGTRLANIAEKCGFSTERDIPVIIPRNSTFSEISRRIKAVRISLGDTDNV